MCWVNVLPALPQALLLLQAAVEIQRAVVVDGPRIKLGEVERLFAALQHGAHPGSHFFIPAGVTHRPPAAITVDLHLTSATVQTSGQPDGLHLCTETQI